MSVSNGVVQTTTRTVATIGQKARAGAAIALLGLALAACAAPNISVTNNGTSPTATTVKAAAPTVAATTTTARAAATAAATATALPIVPVGGYAVNWRNWEVRNNGISNATIDPKTGGYQIEMLRNNEAEWAWEPGLTEDFANYIAEVEVQSLDGPDDGTAGLLFSVPIDDLSEGKYYGYLLSVSRGGKYDLVVFNAGGPVYLQQQVVSPAVRKGNATNRLTAVVRGTRIEIAINGQSLGSYIGPLTKPGVIGVFTDTPEKASGTKVIYTNLRLAPLP